MRVVLGIGALKMVSVVSWFPFEQNANWSTLKMRQTHISHGGFKDRHLGQRLNGNSPKHHHFVTVLDLLEDSLRLSITLVSIFV